MRHLLQCIVVAGFAALLAPAWAQQASDGQKQKEKKQPAAEEVKTAQASGQPKLALSMEEWDFGQKWFGEPAQTELTLTNVGTAPLKIIRVRSSCGCTVGKPKSGGTWNGKVIPPGASEVMVLSYNTRKGAKKVSQKITIETNDPERPRIEFTVRGEVRNIYEAKPANRIIFGQINREDAKTQVLELTNNLEEPVELKLEPLPKNTPFDVRLEELEKGKRYKLIVSTKPPLENGSNIAKVVLRTGLEKVPTLTYPISAYVRPRVSVVPRLLLVSDKIKRPFTRILRVNYRADKPLKITSIESSHPKITAEVMPSRSKAPKTGTASYQIQVNLPPGDQLPKDGAKLIIHTDDPSPEYSKIEVEIITPEMYRERLRQRANQVRPVRAPQPAGNHEKHAHPHNKPKKGPKETPSTPPQPEKKSP